MLITASSYPRAGLVGNPSDGYFGKTISFLFRNFSAEVILYESPELEILPTIRDKSFFSDIDHLVKNVRTFGYYGGIRLLKAAVKRFAEYCAENEIALDKRNFTLRYKSDIPHQVGLGGSSAIVTAAFRAMCRFYDVTIAPAILANLVLSVEYDELSISAGLQDRVVQAYEGMVYMNFNQEYMEEHGFGNYEPLDHKLLPPVYIAYDTRLAERSDVFHNNIRDRFDRGEKDVVEAMTFWAELTSRVHACLTCGDKAGISELLDANFNQRREIYEISPRNIEMVEAARSVGASAKFSGSGGAIVGAYMDEKMYRQLEQVFAPMQIEILKPILF